MTMWWEYLLTVAVLGFILLLQFPHSSLRCDLLVFDRHGQRNATPTQVHISLAGANGIRVSWVTVGSPAPSIVEFGSTSGSYDRVAVGNSDFYSFLLYRSGHIHNVVLENINPSSIYYYKCGGAGVEYSFRTPPAVSSRNAVKFVMAGDLGQTAATTKTLKNIQDIDYDVFLLPGDLSYADYYQPRWDSFGNLVEPLASSRPFMVTQGNHEAEGIPLVADSFRAYNTRWKMSYRESGSDSNLFYSFEVGSVHVLMLGSYADFTWGSAQYKWLQNDLLKVDRSRTPWLIAVLHAPWYNSNCKHQGDGELMRKSMEFILKQAKTDLIISGHVHAYERTTRIFNGNADDCGIMHATVGVGGNREGLANNFLNPKPDWSLYRGANYGYGILNVVNGTHAHWSWHRNEDESSVLADEAWLQSMHTILSC